MEILNISQEAHPDQPYIINLNFDDFDDRSEEEFCWALMKIWSEEPMDESESMLYDYGGLFRRRSSA